MGDYVRISLKNTLGEYSEVSHPVASSCHDSICDEYKKAAEVKGKKKATKEVSTSTTILLILIAILFVLITSYIIYDCTKSNKDQQVLELNPDDSTKGYTKYDKVATESDI